MRMNTAVLHLKIWIACACILIAIITLATEVTEHAVWLIGAGIILIGIAMTVIYCHKSMRTFHVATSDLYGSAAFSTDEEIKRTGLLHNDNPYAVYVGAWKKSKSHVLHYLRYGGESNVFVLGPSRTGKGAGLVVPTLLSYAGSCINTDLKMENWYYTAGYRKSIGQYVLKFNLLSVEDTCARFNPLFEVRQGTFEVRDTQNIVDMIADPDGRGRSDHWTDTANDLLVSIILHVLYVEKDKSLPGVRHFISNLQLNDQQVFEYMQNSIHDPDGRFGWVDPVSSEPTRTHPVVAAGARDMLNRAEAERAGILSTLKRFLKIYRDPLIANNIRTSDFSINDLIDPNKRVTLYLYMPPSDMKRARPLLRLILNLILSRLTESWNPAAERETKQAPFLLLMDEFPQLGRLDFFESALAYTAGYGIKTFLICQDLAQVYQEYGQFHSILSNCEIQIAYAPNKLETARHLSDMLGEKTITKEQVNYSGSRLSTYLSHMNRSQHDYRRQLMTPDELMRMPYDQTLVFKAGHHPILGYKALYFHDPIFKQRADIPAPKYSDKLNVAHPWTYYHENQPVAPHPIMPMLKSQDVLESSDEIDLL